MVKSGGPALLFENPKGSQHSLLINQFGTGKRMCMAFGVDSLDDAAAKLGDILDMQPPEGLRDKVKGLLKLKSVADSRPKNVSKAPCQELFFEGADVDLGRLPVLRCWPGDPAPFITLPAVITQDPQTGTRNVGMYRMQVIDRASTFMHWQMHKDGRADLLAAEDGRIPVAVAIGLDPVTAYSASAPLPKHLDELMLAGFLRGKPVELVKCKTVDLEVPANAEIVLEGHVSKDDVGIEGPFGDHTGYYTRRALSDLPPLGDDHATRRDLLVDRRRQAAGRRRLARQGDRADLPAGRPHDTPRDRRLRPAGRGRLPQLRDRLDSKTFPGHAQKVMHALWGLGMLSLSKSIVVVDADVDVHDYADVLFRVTANVDPKRDVLITEGPLDHLDHAPGRQSYGGKLGIDATHKLPEEDARPWPEEIVMSPDVRELVTRRWAEYGIDALS